MSVLVNSDFSAGLDSWAVVSGSGTITQNSAVGPDDAAGIALIQGHAGGNTTIERTFTCATTGFTKFSFWHKDDATTTVAGSAATTNIYLMLQGGAVGSANATAYLALSRDTGASATSRLIRFIYRNNATFVDDILLPRGSWYKITVVVNHSAKTYDIYFNDLLWVKGAVCPNAGAFSSSGKVAIIQGATVLSTALSFDAPYVEDSYVESLGETTLIDDDFTAATGEIEAHVPDTDTRQINKQPWKIPDKTASYGGFTFNSTNGAKPDAGTGCLAMVRCRPEGIVEVEFKSSATTADIFMSVFGRVWAGLGSDSYLQFKYQGSDHTFYITQGTTTLASTAAVTLTANTTYTLKFEMRGRYLVGSYKAAAMGSGSYTQILAYNIITTTGARGQLSEEHCGFHHASTIASQDNYARRFRFTGTIPSDEKNITIGSQTYNLAYGSVREFYHSGCDAPTRNLGWSKLIQIGHRSEADMGNGLCAQATIYNGTNVKSYRQRGLLISEKAVYGDADCYVTFLRRGPWVSDRAKVYQLPTDINYTPDNDLRGELWDSSFYTASESGSANSRSNSSFNAWTEVEGTTNPCKGIQSLTNVGTNEVRWSQVQRNNLNLSGLSNTVIHKWEGNGDPVSRAFNFHYDVLTDNTSYEAGRGFLVQSGNIALDATTLEQWRDDVKTPATLSMTTGTLTTNASGDLDTDGFNERHGWYEVACVGGLLNLTVPISSGKRFGLAFRVSGCTTNTVVKIAGVTGVENTDYTRDDLGGGVWVIQLLSDRTADTSVEIAAAPSSGGVRGMGSRYGHTLLRP